MKRFLLCTATVLAMFGSISQADAKDPEDQEFRHVVVTLKSGEKVEGYLHRGWHAEGALLKQENYSFKITKTPDDKESVKYTADEVTCIDYAEKTEENPDGIHWDALDIASPSIGNRYNTIRRLVCLDKVGKNATTYWWKIWTTERVGNINRRILKTVHGVRFHDDPDKVVYTYMLVNTMSVRRRLRRTTRGYSTCTTPTSNSKRSSKSTRNFRNKRRGDRPSRVLERKESRNENRSVRHAFRQGEG